MTSRIGILAGGLGRRLRPYTDDRPKVLIALKGRPILDYVIDEASAFSLPISILVGYKGWMIADLYKQYPCIYFADSDGAADEILRFAESSEEDDILVLSGDTLIKKESIGKALDYHLRGNYDATLLLSTCVKSSSHRKFLIQDGRLVDIKNSERTVPHEGIIRIFKRNELRKLAELVSKKETTNLPEYGNNLALLYKLLLINRFNVGAIMTNDWFLNINTLDDIKTAENYLDAVELRN